MSEAKFIQIHTLTSYPGALLNRDDAGFAKRLPFGGTTRTRVSSQCLKYHWRNFHGDQSIYSDDSQKSIRSRETFERRVAQPLIEAGHPAPLVRATTFAIKELLLTGKAGAKGTLDKLLADSTDEAEAKALLTQQITVLGVPEVRYLRELVSNTIDAIQNDAPGFWGSDETDEASRKTAAGVISSIADRDLKKNLKALATGSGLDAAMFGRMVTSDVLARCDAAIHVAHAFTTHAEESESDYFSAVDELKRDEPEASGELGAGHINSQELTSGLFYGYVVVDVPLLVSNIGGGDDGEADPDSKSAAGNLVRRLIHLIATVSPGAKLGSTAPHAYAQFVLVESGSSQPRTLANAFQKAVTTRGKGVLQNSYEAVSQHLTQLDAMYGQTTHRRLAAIAADPAYFEAVGIERIDSLADVSMWIEGQVAGS